MLGEYRLELNHVNKDHATGVVYDIELMFVLVDPIVTLYSGFGRAYYTHEPAPHLAQVR